MFVGFWAPRRRGSSVCGGHQCSWDFPHHSQRQVRGRHWQSQEEILRQGHWDIYFQVKGRQRQKLCCMGWTGLCVCIEWCGLPRHLLTSEQGGQAELNQDTATGLLYNYRVFIQLRLSRVLSCYSGTFKIKQFLLPVEALNKGHFALYSQSSILASVLSSMLLFLDFSLQQYSTMNLSSSLLQRLPGDQWRISCCRWRYSETCFKESYGRFGPQTTSL